MGFVGVGGVLVEGCLKGGGRVTWVAGGMVGICVCPFTIPCTSGLFPHYVVERKVQRNTGLGCSTVNKYKLESCHWW